jgi:hypothetical protein
MPQALLEKLKQSGGLAVSLGSCPFDSLETLLSADIVLSGDTTACSGIVGAGAVIIAVELDTTAVAGAKYAEAALC